MADREITLCKLEGLPDWYSIEWAEHENRVWTKPIPGGLALMYSGRICDADVEGTSHEMLAIADAIDNRLSVSFRRCEARNIQVGYALSSPRNSRVAAAISYEQAAHLATEIRRVLAVVNAEK